MIRVRICTNRCRCHSSCRRSLLRQRPCVIARACSWFFTEVRKRTGLCRCLSICRKSRSAGDGTQIRGKRFVSSKSRICKASRGSVFCYHGRTNLRRISDPEFVMVFLQHSLEPLSIEGRFHPDPRRTYKLDEAVTQTADGLPQAVCLMRQAGVGPVTALAFVLTVGPVSRFANSKKVVSYLGLNPSEDSSAGRQRLGAISKQGNSMMRYLLIEAAQAASRWDPELRRDYQRLKFCRGSAVAKVAIARKLTVRLYWKLREAEQPVPSARMQGSPVSPVVGESLSPY
jgi:hypothetical protein